MTSEISFQKKYKLKDRLNESSSVRLIHPDRIPIIISKSQKSNIASIKQEKFLVPENLTIGQLIFIIRKRIEIREAEAIALFISSVDGTEILPSSSSSVSSIYKQYVESQKGHPNYDGYLYIIYSGENVFG
jgi:GABA(A) receptor-associated protein